MNRPDRQSSLQDEAPPSSACDSRLPNAFVAGTLATAELQEFKAHLSHCASCQQALENAVAEQNGWRTMRESLLLEAALPADSAETRSLTAEAGRLGQLPASAKSTSREDSATSEAHESDGAGLAYYQSMLTPSEDPSMLGRIGNYEVSGLLGHGGMGIVFKAWDRPLNRYVAIKILAPHIASNPTARQRFLREAQATAAIAHQHVIAIHGVAQWQGTPYIVMPYLDCVSLQQRLAVSGMLSVRETLRIGIQVASALTAAHAQGLIHRDVKPANILLERGVDRVVLTDFGLACALDDVRLTHTDTLVGTPQYMSPEQAADQAIDWRTDLFSLGSVLYECCVGRPAYHAATSYGMVRKIIETQPPPADRLNPNVPAWLASLLAVLMSNQPDARFASAHEVTEILTQCLAHVERPTLYALPTAVRSRITTKRSFFERSFVMFTLAASIAGLAYFAVPQMLLPSPSAAPMETRSPQPLGTANSLALDALSNNERGESQSPQRNGVAETLPPDSSNPDGEANSDEQRFTAAPTPDKKKKKKDGKYATASEAIGIAASYYNARKYKEARKPFEAALKLTDDTKTKIRIYRSLMACYRLIPEFEPMRTAAEFVIENSRQSAERSITRRNFLAFAYQRGQFDNLIKRYEKMHGKDKKQLLPVYLLAELYERRDPKKAIQYITLLKQIDKATQSEGDSPSASTNAASVSLNAKLASQLVKDKQYIKAAKLYLEIAPADKSTHAWYLKEAASSFLKAADKTNALKAATQIEKLPAESRNDLLAHFFHRHMGDIWNQLDDPKAALPHYEKALEKTEIAGYRDDVKLAIDKMKAQIEQ